MTKSPHHDNSFIAHACIHKLKRTNFDFGIVRKGVVNLEWFLYFNSRDEFGTASESSVSSPSGEVPEVDEVLQDSEKM